MTQEKVPSRPVVAIIAAAGQGSRLGAQVPKAYVGLRGIPLVIRSIRAMIRSEIVDEIILVISAGMDEYARSLLEKFGPFELPIRIVHGGAERMESVWLGLQAVKFQQAVVLVHDAARALTPPGMIARVARNVLAGSGAVIPVQPVADTIKEVSGTSDASVVSRTLDRSTLRAVQTPQGFDLKLLRQANENYLQAQETTALATDDAMLIELLGEQVRCVQGDPMAFKITTPLDYALARAVTDAAEPTEFEVPSV